MSDVPPTSESLSVFHAPRPFKSAAYVERTTGTNRKNKTLKQILNNERDAQLQRLGIDKKKRDAKRRKVDGASSPPEAPEAQEASTEDVTERRMVPTCMFLCD